MERLDELRQRLEQARVTLQKANEAASQVHTSSYESGHIQGLGKVLNAVFEVTEVSVEVGVAQIEESRLLRETVRSTTKSTDAIYNSSKRLERATWGLFILTAGLVALTITLIVVPKP